MVIGVVVGLVLFGWAIKTGVEKEEYGECLTWQKEAAEYPNYYLVGWQKDQCDSYKVQINTKVIK